MCVCVCVRGVALRVWLPKDLEHFVRWLCSPAGPRVETLVAAIPLRMSRCMDVWACNNASCKGDRSLYSSSFSQCHPNTIQILVYIVVVGIVQ